MSKKYKRKHIPENSLTIIFKFDSEEKLIAFKNDEKYLKIYGELVTTAHQKGVVSIDNFTNP
ncbi:MAG: hypothetical protein ACFE9S_07150 [Candidatus Hermodarchaeota archaeon]